MLVASRWATLTAMRLPALGVAVALSLAGCVEDEPRLGGTTEYVIGGTRTPDGMYPAVGALVYSFNGQSQAGCTGTLIAPTVVLTAAHCLDPQVTMGLLPSAFTFKHDTLGSTQPSIAVTSSMMHEQFDISSGGGGLMPWFDIGLVFLAAPADGVTPMKMPTPAEAAMLGVGTDLELVGYGQTTDEDPQSTGVKFHARTKVIEIIPSEMRVSTGNPDPQNCHGDSGGPAIATLGDGQRTVGVVSRSYNSGQCDNGGVDTRVDAYLTWIHGKVPTGIPCGSGLSPACPPEEMPPEEEDDDGGCCSTGGASQGSLLLGLVVGALVVRRRRRA